MNDAARKNAGHCSAELALWRLLRGRQISGYRFRRRTDVIGRILAFYCAAAKLAIVVESGVANEEPRDPALDEHFATHGFQVLRITEADVLAAPRAVAVQVASSLEERVRELRTVAP